MNDINNKYEEPKISKPLPSPTATKTSPSLGSVSKPKNSFQTNTIEQNNLSIGDMLEFLIQNLDKKTGPELAKILENAKSKIQAELGYVSMIGPISNTIADFSQIPGIISFSELKGFENRIKFWKKKLNL
jgi:hypothetical protein